MYHSDGVGGKEKSEYLILCLNNTWTAKLPKTFALFQVKNAHNSTDSDTQGVTVHTKQSAVY